MSDQTKPLDDAIKELEGWIIKRVFQLLLTTNGKLEAKGSGFFLDVFGLKLLVTTGHVIMDGRHNN